MIIFVRFTNSKIMNNNSFSFIAGIILFCFLQGIQIVDTFAQPQRVRNNLALDKPVGASSVSNRRRYAASKAVDGEQLQGSRWNTTYPVDGTREHDQWLTVDLMSIEEIDKIRLLWQRQRWAVDYQIQVSLDSLAWRTVYTVVDEEPKGWIHNIYFEPVEARYVRLFCTRTAHDFRIRDGKRENINEYSVIEFEIYNTGVPFDDLLYSSKALNKPVYASYSANNLYQVPGQVTDGQMTSFWSVGRRVSPPHWIYVDMEKRFKMEEIILFWHRLPESYMIEISDDAKNWEFLAEEKDFIIEPVIDEEVVEKHSLRLKKSIKCRYVKVLMPGGPRNPEHEQIILQAILIN